MEKKGDCLDEFFTSLAFVGMSPTPDSVETVWSEEGLTSSVLYFNCFWGTLGEKGTIPTPFFHPSNLLALNLTLLKCEGFFLTVLNLISVFGVCLLL